MSLEEQAVTDDAGFRATFTMDPYWRSALLAGQDEIARTLEAEPRIAAYERRRAALLARQAG